MTTDEVPKSLVRRGRPDLQGRLFALGYTGLAGLNCYLVIFNASRNRWVLAIIQAAVVLMCLFLIRLSLRQGNERAMRKWAQEQDRRREQWKWN